MPPFPAPKAFILIPKTCKYVTLLSKRNLVDIIKDFPVEKSSWIIPVGSP